MLAYILALLVGLGSFGLYVAAFFFPEVHRKNDFIWSGVGLFYALVLWVCAGRMTGGVLLGQAAVVSLVGWLGWQTVLLRRQLTPVDQQTPLPTAEEFKTAFTNLASPEGRSQLSQQASRTLGQVKEGVQGAITAAKQAQPEVASETYVPPKLEEFGTAGQDAIERFAKVAIPPETSVEELAEGVQEVVDEAVADLQAQGKKAQNPVRSAVNAANRAIAPSQPPASNPLANLQQQATDLIQRLTAPLRSLLQGATPPQEISPPPVQAAPTIEVQPADSQPYVRKKFREESADPTPTSQPYVRKKYRPDTSPAAELTPPQAADSKGDSKGVYVRKKYRPDASPAADPTPPQPADSKGDSKGVYVRKKYRPDAQPPAETTPPVSALADVTDATVISVSEEITRTADGSLVAEAVIEIDSDTLAPDLLANAMIVTSTADPDATVEDIVEELLDDISVQEEAISTVSHPDLNDSLEPIPPHPPSPDLVEAAIADAEEKGLPFDPPEMERSE